MMIMTLMMMMTMMTVRFIIYHLLSTMPVVNEGTWWLHCLPTDAHLRHTSVLQRNSITSLSSMALTSYPDLVYLFVVVVLTDTLDLRSYLLS